MTIRGLTPTSRSRCAGVIAVVLSLVLWTAPALAQNRRFALVNALWDGCMKKKFPEVRRSLGIDNARSAFDPKSSRNFSYDADKEAWIDIKSLESVCPESSPGRAPEFALVNILWDGCMKKNFPELQRSLGVDNARSAFDPKSGRNFAYDADKKAWTDIKSLENVCPRSPPVGAARPLAIGRRPMLRFGLTYDYNSFSDFPSVAGNQTGIQSFDGETSASGVGAFLEYMYSKKCPLFFGLEYHTSTLTYTQRFNGSNPLLPSRADGRVRGSFLDFYTGYDFRLLRFGLRPKFGVVRVVNELTIEEFFQSLTSERSRSLTNYKTDIGLAIERTLWERRLGVRLGFDYTTAFKSGDADANTRVSLGVDYKIRSPF